MYQDKAVNPIDVFKEANTKLRRFLGIEENHKRYDMNKYEKLFNEDSRYYSHYNSQLKSSQKSVEIIVDAVRGVHNGVKDNSITTLTLTITSGPKASIYKIDMYNNLWEKNGDKYIYLSEKTDKAKDIRHFLKSAEAKDAL